MSQYSWTLVADNDGTNCVLIAGATNDEFEFVRYVVCKVSGKQKLGFRTETRPVNLSVIDAFWGPSKYTADHHSAGSKV